jgi:hypothetical protein
LRFGNKKRSSFKSRIWVCRVNLRYRVLHLRARGSQGGHHPMAKRAFEGVKGYDANDAFTISKSKLDSFGVKQRQ